MMKAYVTGSTGFIGSHLVDRLNAERWEVVRHKRGDTIPNLEGFVVFHAAGVLDKKGIPYEKYFAAHVTLPLYILAHHPSRMVYVSSSSVTCSHLSDYALTKIEGEKLVERGKVDWVIVRPEIVYGPRDLRLYPLFKWIKRLNRLFPIPGSGRNLLHITYVSDVVDVLVEAGEGEKEGGGDGDGRGNGREKEERIITVAGTQTTMNNLIASIAKAIDVSQPFIHIPPIVRSGFFTRSMTLDSSHAKTTLEEGLKETVKWYREKGML